MTDEKITKALELNYEIKQMKDFIYAIDKNTIGTIGHTKNCKIKAKRYFFSLWSRTNCKETEIIVPKKFVCEIGELAKRELKKLQAEFDKL